MSRSPSLADSLALVDSQTQTDSQSSIIERLSKQLHEVSETLQREREANGELAVLVSESEALQLTRSRWTASASLARAHDYGVDAPNLTA